MSTTTTTTELTESTLEELTRLCESGRLTLEGRTLTTATRASATTLFALTGGTRLNECEAAFELTAAELLAEAELTE